MAFLPELVPITQVTDITIHFSERSEGPMHQHQEWKHHRGSQINVSGFEFNFGQSFISVRHTSTLLTAREMNKSVAAAYITLWWIPWYSTETYFISSIIALDKGDAAFTCTYRRKRAPFHTSNTEMQSITTTKAFYDNESVLYIRFILIFQKLPSGSSSTGPTSPLKAWRRNSGSV